MANEISLKEQKHIDSLVRLYEEKQDVFAMALHSLHGYITLSKGLEPLIHTVKYRLKEPSHLKDKLERKLKEAKNEKKQFDINKDNLFLKINDLAGFRIIHLHTRQVEEINLQVKQILKSQQWEVLEGPEAKTWDDESEIYFQSIGFDTVSNHNMYTSVHYVIKPSPTITCELQIRTLMEEVWGEVDHKINYPHKTDNLSCREQIKVLARSTSSCSRLVDCIFSTHNNFADSIITSPKANKALKKAVKKKTAKRK